MFRRCNLFITYTRIFLENAIKIENFRTHILRIFSIQTTNSTIIEWSLLFDEKTESLQLDYADGVYYCSTHNDGGSYAFFYDTPNFPT